MLRWACRSSASAWMYSNPVMASPFAACWGDVLECLHAVGRVVVLGGLANAQDGAVVLRHGGDFAFVVVRVNGSARGPEDELIDRLVVLGSQYLQDSRIDLLFSSAVSTSLSSTFSSRW